MITTRNLLCTTILAAFTCTVHAAESNNLFEDDCAGCYGLDHGGYIAPALNSETLKGRSPTTLRSLIMTVCLI